MQTDQHRTGAMTSNYSAIGVMSGSSLDGMDLAWCAFTENDGRWTYSIRDARTIPYSEGMRNKLLAVMSGTALDLARLHREIGDAIGEECAKMLGEEVADVIGSHGHTIFHAPHEGLTMQIGCGARIAAVTGVNTVCDFRSMDVAFGGQGAPLVPLGEKLLFPGHKAFLNIGGICNVAIHSASSVLGYDVCIGNQALNELAEEAGRRYDEGGGVARSGMVDEALLSSLNGLPFHREDPPRSLGREWFNEFVRPLIADHRVDLADRMRTVVEHIAAQVGDALNGQKAAVLVTGGGALNTFLIERIRALVQASLVVPDRVTVEYKEAVVFALLGVLRLRGEATSLSSVTGAKRDSVGGALSLGNN